MGSKVKPDMITQFSLTTNEELNGEPTEILCNKGVQKAGTEENHKRLMAGGKNELHDTTSHEKFCCCPSAQCYTCKNGRAGNVRKNGTRVSEPSCYWRVPNECPCFGANNQGEVRGTAPTQNRMTGGTIGCQR